MSKNATMRFDDILDQLQVLRKSVSALEAVEAEAVTSLRGHQTVDPQDALHQSFAKIQQQIVMIEETLATIAEATGEIAKF